MRKLRAWFLRLAGLFGRKRQEREMAEELESHLELHIQDNLRRGMTPEAARRDALIKLGGLDSTKEGYRDRRGLPGLESLVQDVRYGARMLRKNPAFTAVAVITLALGIGANTAIFSLLDSVMLRFLPVERPEQLVQVTRRSPKDDNRISPVFTNPIWEQVRDQQDVFSGMLAFGGQEFDLAQGGEAHYAKGLWVSGDFFHTLGVHAAAGRLINVSDDQRGCSGVAVLSYSFWQDHFGGAASALGSTISLDNHTYPIIGVAAPGFYGVEVGSRFDVALPVCATAIFDGARPRLDHRSWWWLSVVGRLRPGISLAQLRGRLELISPRVFAATVPPNWDIAGQKNYQKWVLTSSPVSTGTSGLRRQFERPLQILMGVVGIVLLIACANIAGLMLARAAVRQREMAVRRAVGASRLRLIRQLLTECLLLSAAGALLGILFAHWGSLLLVRFISTVRNQVYLDMSFDWRVLGFTAGITVITAVLFGVLPAFRSTRASLTSAMKASLALDPERQARLRPRLWIVAAQVALSLLLMAGAGLFLRSFVKLVTLDLGFDRANVLMMHAEPRTAGIAPDRWMATWDEIERRLSALPGVLCVSRSLVTPVSGSEWNDLVHADSPSPPSGMASLVYMNGITPGYFKTLRIDVLAGRDFTAQDTATSPKVALINQTMARKFYPNLNPLGRLFRIEGDQGKLGDPIQIVGVVRDSKYGSLREEDYACAYFPLSQAPGFGGGPNFLIRTSVRPSAVLSLIQSTVEGVNKSISIQFNTLVRQVDDSLVQERVLAALSCFFAGLAMLLVMVGLYGAISYMVTLRQTELGVRMALGAAPGSILRLVLRDVVLILTVGVAAGTGITLLSVQLLQSLLFGMAARDTATLALAAGVVSLVAFIAGYLPARRAAKGNPISALRYE